ncbi:MAG: hypothetical protein COB07_06755 [Sulfurovum sp.]|nr:MAG: hypothetical protein COB07_06755 [Sulfurovum sp.]
MKKILIFIIIGGSMLLADSNDTNRSQEKTKLNTEIEKQMEKEKKYAKEKAFYQGEDYDLKAHEVDPDILSKIPSLEPDYDFDMSEGVYTD